MIALIDYWRNQLGGTFLAPGSTLSLEALACTLAVAVFWVSPKERPIRAAVLARALFPRWVWKSASGRTDFFYFLFSVFLAGLVFGSTLLSASQVAAVTKSVLGALLGEGPRLQAHMAARIAVTAVAFVFYEFAYWLDHYLKHKLPVLWRFHAVHHSATQLSLLTNFRVHPIDTVIFYNIVALSLGLCLGAAEWILPGFGGPLTIGGTNVLIMVSAICLTHLQHSQLWVTFGSLWGNWFLSPAHHQIHHSDSPEHHNRNFGSTIAIWDRLFGTLAMPPARRPSLRFGVSNLAYDPHSLRGALIGPFISAPSFEPSGPDHGCASDDSLPFPNHERPFRDPAKAC